MRHSCVNVLIADRNAIWTALKNEEMRRSEAEYELASLKAKIGKLRADFMSEAIRHGVKL